MNWWLHVALIKEKKWGMTNGSSWLTNRRRKWGTLFNPVFLFGLCGYAITKLRQKAHASQQQFNSAITISKLDSWNECIECILGKHHFSLKEILAQSCEMLVMSVTKAVSGQEIGKCYTTLNSTKSFIRGQFIWRNYIVYKHSSWKSFQFL